MKDTIHPEYGAASIRCACGNVIETRSTVKGTIQVDICSSCHPFFTGQQKLMDTAGRIDRFKKKFGTRVALGKQVRQKKTKVVHKKALKREAKPGPGRKLDEMKREHEARKSKGAKPASKAAPSADAKDAKEAK